MLDVNVLIALLDQSHIDHDLSVGWFENMGASDWATCPLTENGLIRILGHVKYPGGPGTPSGAATLLQGLAVTGQRSFWSDDISLLANQQVQVAALGNSDSVTDTYLLALAVRHGGKLATLDRRLSATAVRGGRDALVVIR